ncbi:MAG TPA: DinB family protein [Thermomicrobiales bacterium]|jgi:uncharacterized damage-inducible protein DinB
MRVSDIQDLFDYNAWANERLVTAAAALTAAEFAAPTRFPRASLRGCFLHILNAARFHLGQWQGGQPRAALTEGDCPDVASLATQMARDEAMLRAFLKTLTDADLDQLCTISFGDDYDSVTAPLWKLMVHIVNHGTQHRSDAAQMLTELGHSPGDLDLMDSLPTTPSGG